MTAPYQGPRRCFQQALAAASATIQLGPHIYPRRRLTYPNPLDPVLQTDKEDQLIVKLEMKCGETLDEKKKYELKK